MASVFSQHCFTGQNFVKLRCISCSIGFLSFLILHFVSEPESLCLFSVYSFLSSTHFYSSPVIPVTFLQHASFFPAAAPLHVSLCLSQSPQCQVTWVLCWCEESSTAWALGSRWSALYHSETDSCLSLQGSRWGTEEDPERDWREDHFPSVCLPVTSSHVITWTCSHS